MVLKLVVALCLREVKFTYRASYEATPRQRGGMGGSAPRYADFTASPVEVAVGF